jgi:hypothetical protein
MKGIGSKVLMILGIVFIVVAIVWWAIGVSLLTDAVFKIPDDFDLKGEVKGYVKVFMDPMTQAMLTTPLELPMEGERRYVALPEESDSSIVVLQELISYDISGMQQAEEVSQYVVDRESYMNVRDDRSWSYDPAFTADRSGTYMLPAPGVEEDDVIPMWHNATGIFEIRISPEDGVQDLDGVEVYNFTVQVEGANVTDAFMGYLQESYQLPTEISFDEIKTMMQAQGVDLDALLGALMPVLTPEDAAALQAATAEPIALDYKVSFSRGVLLEPTSGAILNSYESTDLIYIVPDTSALVSLAGIFQKYQDNPQVAEILQRVAPKLAEMDEVRIDVQEISFSQTEESVNDLLDDAKKGLLMLSLVKLYLPLAVIILGALMVLGGWLLGRRSKNRMAGQSTGGGIA